jgi:hypothetical protein
MLASPLLLRCTPPATLLPLSWRRGVRWGLVSSAASAAALASAPRPRPARTSAASGVVAGASSAAAAGLLLYKGVGCASSAGGGVPGRGTCAHIQLARCLVHSSPAGDSCKSLALIAARQGKLAQ